jgi:high-affinity nickel permease
MISLLSIIVIGFVLGMRHATDADHVIAVTTIVSRQGSVRHASLIGAMWGVGHTLTICIVGTAIIVFHVLIPPKVGLAMELCVGLMLVLLGVLNLTGALQWICFRLTPGRREHPEVQPRRFLREDSPDQTSPDLTTLEYEDGRSLN